MMNDVQFNFVNVLFGKIKDMVNGKVKYKYFPQLDAVIFTVSFKNFMFEFPVKDIQNTILNGTTKDEIVDQFQQEYRSAILNAFFKRKE